MVRGFELLKRLRINQATDTDKQRVMDSAGNQLSFPTTLTGPRSEAHEVNKLEQSHRKEPTVTCTTNDQFAVDGRSRRLVSQEPGPAAPRCGYRRPGEELLKPSREHQCYPGICHRNRV